MLFIVAAVLMLIGVLFALAIVAGGTGLYSPAQDYDRLTGRVFEV